MTLNKYIGLDRLMAKVLPTATPLEKLEVLNHCDEVKEFVDDCPTLRLYLAGLSTGCDIAIKSILAIGQGPNVFGQIDSLKNPFEALCELVQPLLEVEEFYSSIGGIVGYYALAIDLISKKKLTEPCTESCERFSHPPCVNLSQMTPEVKKAIMDGIENLPSMGEIYPLGGAGDRLDLRDEETGEPLPAAFLPFEGVSLLEGLIKDLQAKEYVYWKLKGRQLTTPIAMMTSEEKNNEQYILEICKKSNWFGRPFESFNWFKQPLVPVVVETGDLSMYAPLKLSLKPGGHGVIWKLAQDKGIFTWFEKGNRRNILVRQINNPIAGTDYGILAFTGIGSARKKSFGIASCPRLLNAAEGMLLLVEKEVNGGHEYHLSNVEYTDFKASGLTDTPVDPGSPYSLYPANTNILFAAIDAIKEALRANPFPGVLINLKTQMPYIDSQGTLNKAYGGRVESMMQNIADNIVDEYPERINLENQKDLKSFLTYNIRRKTISVTKNQVAPGKSLLETPDACFYDRLHNARELLIKHCHFDVPEVSDLETHVNVRPAFIVYYHPALGPIYDIIGQKIKGGSMSKGSELQLDIAELDIVALQLEGSLRIRAVEICGHRNASIIEYSEQNGKCELIKVKVINQGIDWTADNSYWRNRIKRHAQLEIILHGNAEFFAEGITFEGDIQLEVEAGQRLEVRMVKGKINYHLIQISDPTWYWKYFYDESGSIHLKKILLGEN